MKRNMELTRLLLLQMEGAKVDISPYSQEKLVYHSALRGLPRLR